jgi:ABC-type lipoprotein export system ATPase subunit
MGVANRFPRGSEWRRWDLHVHSPYSSLNSEFGPDFEAYAIRLLEAAAANGIAAIGVTDYYTVEGYRHLRSLLADGEWLARLDPKVREHAGQLLVLANVELRGFVIGGGDWQDSRVNYHVLFGDDLSADDIETHFLSLLRFTSANAPARTSERMAVSRANLETLGERLKGEHAEFANAPAVKVGMSQAVVSHEEAMAVLIEDRSRFDGKYLLVAPIDEDLSTLRWDNQGHLTRKNFIQLADMIDSANPSTRDFALGHKHSGVEEYLQEFVTRKPCIHGSDAHSYDRLFEPDERRYNWIKADPTWLGLTMLLAEPDERVFIGEYPPQLAAFDRRAANTITNVRVGRTSTAHTTERWFETDLPLNPGLCAVIGNRGSGKSALAEIIALVGDTDRVDAFSFLTEARFRDSRAGKAAQFQASLTWGDASVQGPRRLSDDPNSTSVERVRYIGQGFLEEVCNEMDEGENSRFYLELQQVIFSHVQTGQRQGRRTLADLISYLGSGIEQTIASQQDEIHQANLRIIEITHRLTDAHRSRLEAALGEQERRLAAHDAAKPQEVAPPTAASVTEIEKTANDEANRLRADLEKAQSDLRAAQAEDARLIARHGAANRLIDRIGSAAATVRGVLDEGAADARLAGIDLATLVELRVNLAPLESILREIEGRRAALAADLDQTGTGLAGRIRTQQQRQAELEKLLSEPLRRYQEYERNLATWGAARSAIVGSESDPTSIDGIKAELTALDGLPAELDQWRAKRRAATLAIHGAKRRLRDQYAELHHPVSEFLVSSSVAASDAFRLQFEAQVVEAGFADRFLAMINQRRVGPFAGVDEGRRSLAARMSRVDWSSADELVDFVDSLEPLLTDGGSQSLAAQLVQGFEASDLLDYIYGLTYVSPTYKLTWDGRSVTELSPGERGNLLLIFYLLVDRETIPLVIDQPEENLDNQTVFRTLVPCMRDARLRRQVIVVTHNPNLAVVCDADQVIYADMRKDAANAVTYVSGAIENEVLRGHLVDVLEGTRPAFDHRAATYLLPSR